MTHVWISTAAAALAGSLLLAIFYYAVKTEWPASYVSWGSDFGILVNRSVVRYTAFRVVPVYLVSLLVSSAGGAFGAFEVVSGAIVGITAGTPNALHLWSTVRATTSQSKRAVVVLDVAVSLVVISAGVLGGLGLPAKVAGTVLPGVSEFFASFWTTAFVAILAAAILHLSRKRTSMHRLLQRSLRETTRFTKTLELECTKQGVDVSVARVIMLAENLERPSWVRKLEAIKGGPGSYGVMQVYANGPISDIESIRRGVALLAQMPTKLSPANYEYLDHFVKKYNFNEQFLDLTRQLYWEMQIGQPAPARSRSDAVQQLLPLLRNLDGETLTKFVAKAPVAEVDKLSDALFTLGQFRTPPSPPVTPP